MKKYCENCGAQTLDDNATVCAICGTPFENANVRDDRGASDQKSINTKGQQNVLEESSLEIAKAREGKIQNKKQSSNHDIENNADFSVEASKGDVYASVKPKKSRGKIFIIVAAIVVIGLILVLVGSKLFSSKKSDGNTTNETKKALSVEEFKEKATSLGYGDFTEEVKNGFTVVTAHNGSFDQIDFYSGETESKTEDLFERFKSTVEEELGSSKCTKEVGNNYEKFSGESKKEDGTFLTLCVSKVDNTIMFSTVYYEISGQSTKAVNAFGY